MDIERAVLETGLDREDLELIASAFERVATGAVVALREAIGADDIAAAQQALHKFAGSSAAILGGAQINTVAKEAEEAIKAKEPLDLQATTDRLVAELKKMGVPV